MVGPFGTPIYPIKIILARSEINGAGQRPRAGGSAPAWIRRSGDTGPECGAEDPGTAVSLLAGRGEADWAD
jgi:hypothetical protein